MRQDDFTLPYWRVWVKDDSVRVARDTSGRGDHRCQHLALRDDGRIEWRYHRQGGVTASVPMFAFITWLAQRGHVDAVPDGAS